MEPLRLRHLNNSQSKDKEAERTPQGCSAQVQSLADSPTPSPRVADCFDQRDNLENAPPCVAASVQARMPLFHEVHYPRLPVSASPPRQRKPGLTKAPSYTSSPIIASSPRSPANVCRKRANAISLASSPARHSHSDSMTRIFEKSRETVQFQEEVRKRSAEERRQMNKENRAMPKITAGSIPVAAALPGLPALSPLSRLTDDIPGRLIISSYSRVTPSKPFHARSSRAADRAGSISTPSHAESQTMVPSSTLSLSPVESWLSTLPDQPDQSLQTPSRPNTSKLRSSTVPLSPSAKTHRLCASASSIAERIQMRTPSFVKRFEPERCPVRNEATDHPTTSLFSRLLKPAARPARKDSGVWAAAKLDKLESGLVTTGQRSDIDVLRRSSEYEDANCGPEEASDKSSAPSDSGSSDVLHLPKLRHHDSNAFDTPKARQEHEEVRNVTPEVAVYRKGKGPKKTRCTSYFDQDVIPPLNVRSRKEMEDDK